MKTNVVYTFLMVLIFGINQNTQSQDIIVFKDGNEIKAVVNEVGTNEIKYKKYENKTGPTYSVLKTEVFEIKYENGTKDVFGVGDSKPVSNNKEGVNENQVKPADVVSKPKPGSIKIFSEFSGVDVYLDDKYIGKDIKLIEPVEPGSHYIKAIKEKVIIYGSLINVFENIAVSVLIKNSEEVQEKLLAAKYNEQQEYKSGKLDILIDTKYITKSSGRTNSVYYPGFGSALYGISNTSTTSVTTKSTEWFITKGGNKKISDLEFANITNNQRVIDIINKRLQKKKNLASVGAAFLLPGLAAFLVGMYGVVVEPSLIHDQNANIGLFAGGLVAGVIGVVILEQASDLPAHYYEFNYAVEQAKEYNQKLKAKLGLPENYEPKE